MAQTKIDAARQVDFDGFSAVRAGATSDQTIGNASWTTVNFATEQIDTLGEWSTNTFTAQEAGRYVAVGCINYDNSNSGNFYAVNKSGTMTGSFSSRDYGDNQPQKSLHFHGGFEATAGETLPFQTYQNSGGNETLDYRFTWIAIARVA